MSPKKTAEEKRKDIVRAAYRVLSSQGYAATTIQEVALQAGVSRGLLHYYFSSKDDMLIQAIRYSFHRSMSLMSSFFENVHTIDTLIRNIAQDFKRLLVSDPHFMNIFIEGWSVSQHSEAIAEEFKKLYQAFRSGLRDSFMELRERGIIKTDLSPEGLAFYLTALLDGVCLQISADPHLINADWIWSDFEQLMKRQFGY